MLFIALLSFGCAQSPSNFEQDPGGVLAIPVRIHAEVKPDQFLILEGNKPFSFRIKIYPVYEADGTIREKQAYDDFAFSDILPAGIYEIKSYSFESSSNKIITNSQNKMTDLVGEKAIFRIKNHEITMLDKVLQITGAHYKDPSLKHWSGKNIASSAFEDFTIFLKPGDVDRSFRVWRWLDLKGNEFQRYNNMLNSQKSSDFWHMKLASKPDTFSQDYKQIDKVGDLIVFSNDTIKDIGTGLMWSVNDNGFDLNWNTANNYCENLSLGGYKNWRLPTPEELSTLNEKNVFTVSRKVGTIKNDEGVFLWTSSKRIAPLTNIFSGAGLFSTSTGTLLYFHPSNEKMNRVLPVRNFD